MNWGLTGPSLRGLIEKGYVRVGRHTPDKPQTYEISYLTSGRIADIEGGKASVTGRNPDGSVIAIYDESKIKMPISSWHRPSHNAEIHEIGRAHVSPVTNAHLVCRLMLETKKNMTIHN